MARIVLIPHPASDSAIALPLADGAYQVGRSSQCQVLLESPSVSRRHACLTVVGHRLTVTDLGSRNGTSIDGVRVQMARALPGQIVTFGSVAFLVTLRPLELPVNSSDDDTTTGKMCKTDVNEIPFGATPAQKRILDLLLQGLREKQIADQLYLSVHTVHTHARALYRLYGVHSRSELLVRALHSREPAKSPAAPYVNDA